MKKYFQSLFYIVFVLVCVFALITAVQSYENPFNLYENPLVWVAFIALVLVLVVKEFASIVSRKEIENSKLREQGIDPSTVQDDGFRNFIKRWTKSKDLSEENEIILDHNYDGIQELDNILPPWWLYMFYGGIIFGIVYMINYHVLSGDSQVMEYQREVAAANLELEKFKKNSPTLIIDVDNVELLTEERALKRGKAVFNINCASCHAMDGGGGIGPNLTDKNWILGGGIKNVFSTITNGGRSGKGMVPWGKQLKAEDIQKVASYVLSLQGTTPVNPKVAEGEIWEEEIVNSNEEQEIDSIQVK